MKRSHETEVLVIGGGPAGMAAAVSAAEQGARVALVDDNPHLGGQIWRQGQQGPAAAARPWLERLAALSNKTVDLLCPAAVFDARHPHELSAETADGAITLQYQRLVLALGAAERFVPFPGWTLPGVMGAGGLQALVKGGFDVTGKRVVVAGSGPLLLAVAAYLRQQGARVVRLAEQAPRTAVAGFASHLLRQPGKLLQAVRLQRQLLGCGQRFATWPVRANGGGTGNGAADNRLEEVVLAGPGGRQETIACDLLACGFGLVPNVGMAAYLGCALDRGAVQTTVRVDSWQRTSLDGVYCVGESTGIGGVDVALIEGQIAGLHAAGKERQAQQLQSRRQREQRFADALERAFALRDEVRQLADDDTTVCRCEDVRWGQIRQYEDIRDCKLNTRCGMGPCQGRICGGALELMVGWQAETIRPPFFPVTLETLAQSGATEDSS